MRFTLLLLALFATSAQASKVRLLDSVDNDLTYLNFEGTHSMSATYNGFRVTGGTHQSEYYDYDFYNVGYTYFGESTMVGASHYSSTNDVSQSKVYGTKTFGTTSFSLGYTTLQDGGWDYSSDKGVASVAHIHNMGDWFVRGALLGEYLADSYGSTHDSMFKSIGLGYSGAVSVYVTIRDEMDLYGAEGIAFSSIASYTYDKYKVSALYYQTDRELHQQKYAGFTLSYLF